MTRLLLASALLLGLAADVLAQDAQGRFGRVIRIDIDAFSPDAGKITFSEKRRGTRNPRYGPGDYGAKAGAPRVSFAGWFVGQSRGSRSQCPRGANPSGCVVGEPSAPLRLAQRAPETFVAADGA
ncbi:MAG: PEP-CTERM sorting domain-containing protein, partial [Pseudomonadota bacterium]